MQQRLLRRLDVEIAGLQPERDVCEESGAGENVAAQLRVGTRQHPEPAQNQHCAEHDDQRRKDSPDAPRIEGEQTEALFGELARDEAGNQKAGDHEENVDADEPARPALAKGVKGNDQQHRHGAQAVDIRPIFI